MKRSGFILPTRLLNFLPLAVLAASAGLSHAAVSVTGTSLFDAGSSRFTYNYSVTNSGTTEDIIQVTFPVSASAALLGLTAPTGFRVTYDTVQSFVNFIWDDDDQTMQTFSPNSTVSGFSFTSPDAPGPVTFFADDINMQFTGQTIAPTAVPEPSAMWLGLAATGLLLRRRR